MHRNFVAIWTRLGSFGIDFRDIFDTVQYRDLFLKIRTILRNYIFEQFLNLHGYIYVRLDGSVKTENRQKLVDRFNYNRKIF